MAKVRLIGIEHREGISKKTGKPYNTTILFVEHEPEPTNPNLIGKRVEAVWVNSTFNRSGLIPEKMYRVVYGKDDYGKATIDELIPA